MADPHKLRKGARIVVYDPQMNVTYTGSFGGIIPPKENARRVRERMERIVVHYGPNSVAYVPIIQGTEVKHAR